MLSGVQDTNNPVKNRATNNIAFDIFIILVFVRLIVQTYIKKLKYLKKYFRILVSYFLRINSASYFNVDLGSLLKMESDKATVYHKS